MYIDLLIIFVIVSILFLIISIILVEENPRLSVVFIIVGLIFTVYCSFGFMQVQYVLGDGTLYTDESYAEPFGWGFFFIAMIYAMLFFYAGYNYMRQMMYPGEKPR
jgi:predicted membrane protein